MTEENERLDTVLKEQDAIGVHFRLVVANDLSKELIGCLGSSLDISPDMFEEHLLDSGLQDPPNEERNSETWITRNTPKDYVSFKWYRPVRRNQLRSYSEDDRSILLTHPSGSLSWHMPGPGSNTPRFVKHESRFIKNILRRNWAFEAEGEDDPDEWLVCAWEERATIWSKRRHDYQISMSTKES